MVCQACFIFLLQSSFLLIYASNASFREASKISSPFSICSSVMVSGARFRYLACAITRSQLKCSASIIEEDSCSAAFLSFSSSTSFRLSLVTLGFVRTTNSPPWIYLFNPVFTFDALQAVCKIAPSYRLLQTVFPCFQLQNFCKLRDLHHISTIHKTLLLPLILLHIYTSICLKLHTLVFQKHLLLSPAWCSTPCMVHNSVAGILPVKFCHT